MQDIQTSRKTGNRIKNPDNSICNLDKAQYANNFMKYFTGYIILILMAVGLSTATLYAQKRPVPRPPIYGIPAKTLPRRHMILRGYYMYFHYNKEWSSKKDEMVNIPDSTSFKKMAVVMKFRYGIFNNLTFIANFPFVYRQANIGNIIKKQSSGIGDMVGAFLYRFYYNKNKRLLTSMLLYTKYPTGKSGNIASNALPLGTGSFDAGVAFLPEWEYRKLDMRGSLFYQIRGTNKDSINLGDMSSASLSIAYNFNNNFIAENSLSYKYSQNNSKSGKEISDSYTYLLQYIIGAQYRIKRSFLAQIAAPVTLKSKIPLSQQYELWAGLYYMH